MARRNLPKLTGKVIGKTSEGRPIVLTEDGGFATERSVTVTDPRLNNGKPTVIPTVFDGKQLDQMQAIKTISQFRGVDPETGRELPSFETIEEADRFARQRSRSLDQDIGIKRAKLKLLGGPRKQEQSNAPRTILELFSR